MKIIDVLCFHMLLLLFPLSCELSLYHRCFHSLYSFSSPLLHLPSIFPLEILVLLTSVCADCFCQLLFRSLFSVLQCDKYIEAIHFYDYFFQAESQKECKRCNIQGKLWMTAKGVQYTMEGCFVISGFPLEAQHGSSSVFLRS